MIYQLFFITIFVGVFSCLASACAAQTIKFRSVDHLLCSICGLLFVIGIAYPAFSNPLLNQYVAIFIVLQIVVAIIAFWRSWVDADYLKAQKKQA